MCKSCGPSGVTALDFNIQEINTVQNLFDKGYKLVRYNGRTYATTIGSPTGVITEDGLKNYGRGQSGDFLLVHPKDIQHSPTIFTVIESNTDAYKAALTKYGLTEKVSSKKISVAETPIVKSSAKVVSIEDNPVEPTVTEQEVSEPEIVAVEHQSTLLAKAKTEDTTEDMGGRILSRAEALPLKEFTDRYGFTHHMQVLTKVRTGELKSYKNDDDKPMIYHYEE